MLTFADEDVLGPKADVRWNSDHIPGADGCTCNLGRGTQWVCSGQGVLAPWAGLASASPARLLVHSLFLQLCPFLYLKLGSQCWPGDHVFSSSDSCMSLLGPWHLFLQFYVENTILCLISRLFGRLLVWNVGPAHTEIAYTQLVKCNFHSRMGGKASYLQGEHSDLRLNKGVTSLCIWEGKHLRI